MDREAGHGQEGRPQSFPYSRHWPLPDQTTK